MTEKNIKFLVKVELKKLRENLIKNFLGHLPIHQDLRSSADNGDPLTHSDPDHDVSILIKNIATKVKQSFQ